MMKKPLLLIPASIILLFFFRFFVFVPEHYHSPVPVCTTAETFDWNIKGTHHLSELKSKLTTKSADEYRYFFKTFLEEEKTYLVVNFRNDNECFDVKMLVDKWDKLAGMRRTNGKSYPNELFDLKWEISVVDGIEEVVYLGMHSIVD